MSEGVEGLLSTMRGLVLAARGLSPHAGRRGRLDPLLARSLPLSMQPAPPAAPARGQCYIWSRTSSSFHRRFDRRSMTGMKNRIRPLRDMVLPAT